VSDRLPVVAGDRLVRALQRVGWVVVRQRGSHCRLQKGDIFVSVPVHRGRALPNGTLAGILSDAGLSARDLRKLL
jgi:predicted RNA binding protein YcfA (HicA-like mRNA interferase family)